MPGGWDPFSVSTGLTDCHEKRYFVRGGYLFGVGLVFGLFYFFFVWFGFVWLVGLLFFFFFFPGER